MSEFDDEGKVQYRIIQFQLHFVFLVIQDPSLQFWFPRVVLLQENKYTSTEQSMY